MGHLLTAGLASPGAVLARQASAPIARAKVWHLMAEEVALTHRLDPMRPAVVGGAERGENDTLGDSIGYNGDGASVVPDPGILNFVVEHGSTMAERADGTNDVRLVGAIIDRSPPVLLRVSPCAVADLSELRRSGRRRTA